MQKAMIGCILALMRSASVLASSLVLVSIFALADSPVPSPREMAERLEKAQVSGIGVLLPDPDAALTNDAGRISLSDAAGVWPAAFLAGVEEAPVSPGGLVDVFVRTDETTGIFLFEDASGSPFWAEAPDDPVPGNWIAPFRRASPDPSPDDALYAPHRVVDRWRVETAAGPSRTFGGSPVDTLSPAGLPGFRSSSPSFPSSSFAFSSFTFASNGLSMDLSWPVETLSAWNRALALDEHAALDLFHKNRLEAPAWRWLLRSAVAGPASGVHSILLSREDLPLPPDFPDGAPVPAATQTNIVLSPFGFLYTNVVCLATTNAPLSEPPTSFFRAGTLRDSDMDGLSDAFETLVLGSSPSLRDTDGDGLVDGSDPSPLASDLDPATGALADLDGDALPDAWELFRLGATNALHSATGLTASGFTANAALASGLDPLGGAPETSSPAPALQTTFAAPAFRVDAPPLGQILWERTFPIERHAGWEQFYLSARPDPASDEPSPLSWTLENLVLEWEDDKGASGTASSLSTAFRLPLSPDSPTALTLRLRASAVPAGPAVSPRPLYLLRWTPVPVFDGLPQTTTATGADLAVLVQGDSVRIALDFASGHCPGAFVLDPASSSPLAVPLPPGASMAVDEDGFVVSDLPADVYEFPAPSAIVASAFRAPALRTAPVVPGPPVLLVLGPYLHWEGDHGCDTFAMGREGQVLSSYPLDAGCLAESFNTDATGRFDCLATPVLELGVPDAYLDLFSDEIEVEELSPEECNTFRATAALSFAGTEIWSGTADHYCPGPSACENPLSGDACGCETCVSCDDLDGPSVSSFAFRVALGSPRDGQVSGFVYVRSEASLPDLAPASFLVFARADATVLDETSPDGTRTVACHDHRGRTVEIAPVPTGVHLDVRDTATGDLLNAWDLLREPDAVRVTKTSRSGSRMLDERFTLSGGEWTSADLVSGASESVRIENFMDDPYDPRHVEDRTVRDDAGTILSREVTVRRPVGTGEAAVLRPSERIAYPDTDYAKTDGATWWDDPDCLPRHGKPRFVFGDTLAWRWTDYDEFGRETLAFDQCDGSEAPWEFLSDTRWTLETLPGGIDAIVTLSDYAPLSEDSADILDSGVPRTVSRYRLYADGTSVLAARTWTTVARRTEGGLPVVETRTERAGAQDAAPGDPRNAVSVSARYAPDAPGVPFALRGKPLLETGEDGASTVFRHEFGDWTAAAAAPSGANAPGAFVPSPSVAFVRTRSMRVTPAFPLGIPSVSEISETVSDATYENEVWSATRALLAASSDPLSDDAALSDPFAWESRAYDEKNRLRAVLYPDGTSSTNAYSCCRLLFSVGRDGLRRDRLSSADRTSFHWTDLETGLNSLPHMAFDGNYNWIQNYPYEYLTDIHAVERRLDPLGRETYRRELPLRVAHTNSLSSIHPAHAETWCAIGTTLYPDGTSDHRIETDPRGIVTETEVAASGTNVVTVAVRRDGAAVLSRRTVSSCHDGSRRVETTESGGEWTRTETFSSFLADGRIRRFSVVSSSDGPVITNRVEETDFLGRTVLAQTPLSVVSNVYFGASLRLAASFDLTSGTSTSPVYDALLEMVGSTRPDGVSDVSTASFEVRSNALWRVSRELAIAGSATNVLSRTSELLTGLSLSRTSLVETETASGGLARVGTAFDPATKIATETTERDGFAPSVRLLKFGRTIRETGPDGLSRWYYFDPYGRADLVRETGEGGTVYYRDSPCRNEFGDVIEETRYRSVNRPSRALTRWNGFDARGNKVASTNEIGEVSLYGYDALDRLVSVSGEAQWPVRYGYDAFGRRTSLSTTRDGSVWDETHWAYDDATGLCTNKTYADATAVSYTHAPGGKPLRTTLASGKWTENAYDAHGRLSAVSTSDGSGGHVLSYDAFGRVAAVADGGSAFDRTFLRRADGLVTNETWIPHAADAESPATLERAFDAWGRLSARTLSSPATPGGHPAFSSATTVEYSTNGLVSAVIHTNAAGRAMSAEFAHDCGKISGISLSAGTGAVHRAVSRDGFLPELVTEMEAMAGTNLVVSGLSLGYDDLGRPVSRVIQRSGSATVLTNAFAYDSRSEVVSATFDPDAPDTYAYDEIGNRVSSSDLFGERTYDANEVNAYLSISNVASAAAVAPVRDSDGNLAAFGDWAYQWDARGRLVAASRMVGGIEVFQESFAYDWQGRLASRTVARADGATETHDYFWDDWLLLRERVADSSGETNDIEYVWGPDLSGSFQGAGGIGGLLAVSFDGAYYFPFYDQIGNVLGYTDESGAVAAAYDNDVFGNICSATGPLAAIFRHRFSTKLFDPDTGLCYYGYRWYSPALGRWLSRAPNEEDGGAKLYVFANNTALLHFDGLGAKCTPVSDPTPAPPYFWRVLKFEMDPAFNFPAQFQRWRGTGNHEDSLLAAD